ncbi:MAG: hypothetical protein JSS02_35090 [Planctomycetes bacterium]|nr:hypothetical protein [Planctomycetota bacterium]
MKCPDCETKVKVPAGDGTDSDSSSAKKPATAKRPVRKTKGVDDEGFLAALDLDAAVDSSHAMCPKCGASLPEDADECPKCGVDPTTGQLSARAKKRRGMKGPDPKFFWRAAWTDSWAFTKENFTVGLRTLLYTILVGAVGVGCSMAANAIQDPPPKIFFIALQMLTNLIMPGWQLCVILETIRVSCAKKSNITRLHFDVFNNIALGIKWFLWLLAFVVWMPIAFVMMPLAMVHLAMPVTMRGWVNFLLAPTFFRNLGPTLYYWLIWFCLKVPILLPLFVSALVLQVRLLAIVESLKAQQKPTINGTELVILIAALGTTALIYLVADSFVMLFLARVIGLIAYYFQNQLDLVTFIAEKEYKRKEVKVDAWGNPIKTNGQKMMEVGLIIGVLLLVTGVGWFAYMQLFKKN